MSLSQRAVIAQVPVGNSSIEGLMAEDGTFGIAVPQLVSYNLVPPNRSLKQVKALYSIDISSHQWRTELNSKAVNVILLSDFERLLRKLDKAGNKQAEQMVDDLVGLSLHQLFSDAHKVKFEQEERQAYLIDRQCHREDFHPKFTAWLKLDGCMGNGYAIEVNNFKRLLGLPIESVNSYDSKQLRKLDVAYIKYDTLRTAGMKHEQVINSIA
jgi:hypothetical protein